MIKAIRKKESVIKEVIISEAIIWMVGGTGLGYIRYSLA